MISLDQPAGASTQPKMQYIPPHQQLTGQCPECGWTPPPQNQFRPNNFNEYMDDKGRISVLSETDPEVKIVNEDGVVLKTYRRYRDNNGRIQIDPTTMTFLSDDEIEQQTANRVGSPNLPTNHQTAPPARLKVPSESIQPAPTLPVHRAILTEPRMEAPVQQQVVPSVAKQPPVKTAEEIAATPKVTAESIKPVLPTPVLNNPPADLPVQPKTV